MFKGIKPASKVLEAEYQTFIVSVTSKSISFSLLKLKDWVDLREPIVWPAHLYPPEPVYQVPPPWTALPSNEAVDLKT